MAVPFSKSFRIPSDVVLSVMFWSCNVDSVDDWIVYREPFSTTSINGEKKRHDEPKLPLFKPDSSMMPSTLIRQCGISEAWVHTRYARGKIRLVVRKRNINCLVCPFPRRKCISSFPSNWTPLIRQERVPQTTIREWNWQTSDSHVAHPIP